MGRLSIDRRTYEIDDADLVNLQPVLMQALAARGSVALSVCGRDSEDHLLVAAERPLTMQVTSPVTANADMVERMLDELALLGSIAVVGAHA